MSTAASSSRSSWRRSPLVSVRLPPRSCAADEGAGDEVLEDHACLTCHGFQDNEDDAPLRRGPRLPGVASTPRTTSTARRATRTTRTTRTPRTSDVLTMQCGECHDDAFEHLQGGPTRGSGARARRTPRRPRRARPVTARTPSSRAAWSATRTSGTTSAADASTCGAQSEGDDPHDPTSCIACHGGHETRSRCGDCHEDVYDTAQGERARPPARRAERRRRRPRPAWRATARAHGILATSDRAIAALHPLNVPRTCGTCHFEHDRTWRNLTTARDCSRRTYMDDTHGHALLHAGLIGAPTCVSCHGGHDVPSPRTTRRRRSTRNNVSEDCGKCHVGILEQYRESVHGRPSGATPASGERQGAGDVHGLPPAARHRAVGHQLQAAASSRPARGATGSRATVRGTYHGRVTRDRLRRRRLVRRVPHGARDPAQHRRSRVLADLGTGIGRRRAPSATRARPTRSRATWSTWIRRA